VTPEVDGICAIKSRVDRYTYRAESSPGRDEYLGLCMEFPYLKRRAPTAPQAVAAIEEAVKEYVDGLRVCGETPPTPITDRNYSGTFVVRTSPELHGRLALEAAEQRVSMNQWIVQKLSGRTLSDTFGLSGFD